MIKNLADHKLEIITVQYGEKLYDVLIRGETSDRLVLGQIFIDQSYNLSRLKRFDDIKKLYSSLLMVNKTPLVIDAGANIGASSLYFHMAMSGCYIVAIEPDESNYHILRENTNRCNVKTIHAALTSDSHDSKVFDIGNAEWGFVTAPLGEESGDEQLMTQIVPGVTIPEVVERNAHAVPFIVKIDIEGAESEVFSQNTDWIKKIPLVIVEPHDWLFPKWGTMVNFFRALSDMDFDFEVHGENVFVINNDPNVWTV